MSLIHRLSAATALCVVSAFSAAASETNHYSATHFVANKQKYSPSFAVEKNFINAWGIADRPAGAGGHFWVVAKDVSYEYVGDVQNAQAENLRKLHVDSLKYVTLPVGGEDNVGTGVVFSNSTKDFVVTQKLPSGEAITAPAKFIFASDGGILSAWTERKKDDGSFDRPLDALTVVDQSKEGAQFFGVAISHDYDTLYVADFGAQPAIRVFGGDFAPRTLAFDMPFDDNKNGQVDAGEYAPFNIQAITTPAGEPHLFVAYAKTQACPPEEIEKNTCRKDELFVGEEDTAKPGYGRVAEFTEEGKLVAVWPDGGHLSAPWGMTFAPQNFGKLSGALLVANFGDGTIAAYDAKTRQFIDVMRKSDGKPVVIDKIWGLMFGNGESLGDKDSLYFTAGPDDEKDGVFGRLRLVAK